MIYQAYASYLYLSAGGGGGDPPLNPPPPRRPLEISNLESFDVGGLAAICGMEWPAYEDGACESPCVDQSAINSISGYGTSEIISPQPNQDEEMGGVCGPVRYGFAS